MKKADRRKLAVMVLAGARKRIEGPRKWIRRAEIRAGIGSTTIQDAKDRGLLPGPNEPDLDGAFCAYGAIAYEAYRRGAPKEVVDEAVEMLVDAIKERPGPAVKTLPAGDRTSIFVFNDAYATGKKDVLDVFDKAIEAE